MVRLLTGENAGYAGCTKHTWWVNFLHQREDIWVDDEKMDWELHEWNAVWCRSTHPNQPHAIDFYTQEDAVMFLVRWS